MLMAVVVVQSVLFCLVQVAKVLHKSENATASIGFHLLCRVEYMPASRLRLFSLVSSKEVDTSRCAHCAAWEWMGREKEAIT